MIARLLLLVAVVALATVLLLWALDAWNAPDGVRAPDRGPDTSVPVFPRERPVGRATVAHEWHDPVVIHDALLTPVREQDVASQIEGLLAVVSADLGQLVDQGQTLARLDDSRIRLLVEQQRLKAASMVAEQIAASQYHEADARVQVDYLLRPSGAVSEEEVRLHLYQRDRAALEISKAREERQAASLEYQRLLRELELHTLTSGLAGEVLKVHKRLGEAIRPLEPVFRIGDVRRLRIEGLCPVGEAERLRPGMKALVLVERPSQPVAELRGHTGPIAELAVSADGGWLASASADHTAMVWRWPGLGRRAVLVHPDSVETVTWGPGGPGNVAYRLLTGCADGKARIYALTPTGEVGGDPQVLVHSESGSVLAVAFSADGTWCATAGEDKRVWVWDIATGQRRYELRSTAAAAAHQGAVTAVHFTEDGHLVTAGRDNAVRVWALTPSHATLLAEFPGRTGDVTRLGIHRSGRQLLFDHGDELRLVDRETGERLGAFVSDGHGHFQHFATFGASGRVVLTSTANGRVQLWKAPAAPEASTFLRRAYRDGFGPHVFTTFASLSDSLIGVGPLMAPWHSSLATAPPIVMPRLWCLPAYEVRHLVTPDAGGVTCGAFTPDEQVAFTAGTDKLIRVWALPPAGEYLHPAEGELTLIGTAIEGTSGQVRIRAEVTNRTDLSSRLRPGTYATLIVYPEAGPR